MITCRALSEISKRISKQGGRQIAEGVLEHDYCLAWILVGIARSPLRDILAFKGGTALKKCYFADYRFSADLDFTLLKETPWAEIQSLLATVANDVERASGMEIRFDRLDRS